VPWALCALTCGAASVLVVVELGAGAGAGSLVVGAGAGASVVGVAGVVSTDGLVSVALNAPSSAASELAGKSSSDAAAQASRSVGRRVIAQLPSR
jgi:hypothetical protein